MKYLIEIPEEVERELEERALVSGEDIAALIQTAVRTFLQTAPQFDQLRRRPDLNLDTLEVVPPCDLPRNVPRLIPIQNQASRQIDPITDAV